ncbi:rhomboid family intramembrane serine protease GlpG [Glaciecola sp. XM2]|uniref:rhomboid family intramembrane serine protease GlpG n=1 Tax=Glaciecola sp. XM2 TaxID=1914931 RepID=UPI001BDE1B59|nr:rhomboid family intramembrane serine protease GlpG [Glaciecola sp. XM2]MBT1451897.1 rhomboid family intramembrane serine protease GlpG [Glaciecola sp. XM2]
MQNPTPFIRFGQEQPAQLLAAYLREQGIQCTVTAAESDQEKGFMLLLFDESQKAQATSIAQEFLSNPRDPKFQKAAWETGEVSSSSGSMLGASSLPTITDLAKSPFTIGILLLNIFIYLASITGSFDFWYNNLTIQYFDQLSANHQWWRLFGPNFLHFSATHIVFNLIWWWIFGGQLERVFGTFSLVTLFVVASLFANISQLLVSGPNFGGMSGVVYALFGFVWWIGWLRPSWGISIPNGFVVFLLIWLVVGYSGVLTVDMANQAHTFGLISGCLLAITLHLLMPKSSDTHSQ